MKESLEVLAAFITGCLVVWLPTKRSLLQNLETTMDALPTGRLDHLVAYAQVDDPAPADKVWGDLGGIAGLLQLHKELGFVLKVLQYHRHHNLVTRKKAAAVYKNAHIESFFHALAILEAMPCALWSGLPHVAAAAAVRYHWIVTLQTLDLCQVEGSPECMKRRRALI